MSEIQFTNLEQVLNDYGLRVTENYRRHLATPIPKGRHGKIIAPTDATGTLSRKVHPELVRKGDTYELWIDFGVEYWQWLEGGTAPHWPPPAPIQAWVKKKPVIPYRGDDGRLPTQKQLVFLIRRKIGIEGTPALHFLEKSEEHPALIAQLCQEAAEKDIENWINEIMEMVENM